MYIFVEVFSLNICGSKMYDFLSIKFRSFSNIFVEKHYIIDTINEKPAVTVKLLYVVILLADCNQPCYNQLFLK